MSVKIPYELQGSIFDPLSALLHGWTQFFEFLQPALKHRRIFFSKQFFLSYGYSCTKYRQGYFPCSFFQYEKVTFIKALAVKDVGNLETY